jgi:hypothetical protein
VLEGSRGDAISDMELLAALRYLNLTASRFKAVLRQVAPDDDRGSLSRRPAPSRFAQSHQVIQDVEQMLDALGPEAVFEFGVDRLDVRRYLPD